MARLSFTTQLMMVLQLLAACENKTSVKDDQSVQSDQAYSTAAAVLNGTASNDETVSPPANISGSYLYCRAASIPFDDAAGQAIGCNIYDEKTSKKIIISTVASDIAWSYDKSRLAPQTAVTIYKTSATNQTLPYDVYYSFTSPMETMKDILRNLTIRMQVTDLKGAVNRFENKEFAVPPPSAPAPEDVPATDSIPNILNRD